MLEREWQQKLIRKLRVMFPGCYVLKNDPTYIQGFPDLTILWGTHWACLETKRSNDAGRRPNQEFYVEDLNSMSYAAFISPETETEVLGELSHAFGVERPTRISVGK